MTRLTYAEEPHDIWVIAEMHGGQLTELTKELVYGARTIADMMGFYVKVALLGPGGSDLAETARELYPVGADRVYVAGDDGLAEFSVEAWLKVLSDLFVAQAPEFVLMGATPIGDALVPRLAQRFGAGFISHSVMLKVDDFDRCFIGRRAAFGGEYYDVMTTAGSKSHFATVLPDTFGEPYPDHSRYGEVEAIEVNLDGVEAKVKTIGPIDYAMPQPKLKHARRIVAVGRQVGDVTCAQLLAEKLGAEFAGAREALDEGYVDEDHVVGVTGERVSPDLYIALGIRGDTMHSYGMKGARYVVAVHPDPDAPILKQADVAMVGDPGKFAGELAELLNEK
jgi:electron transfer flavoprotein alpha subunit